MLKPQYRLLILIFLRKQRSLFAGCLFHRYPLARLPLNNLHFCTDIAPAISVHAVVPLLFHKIL